MTDRLMCVLIYFLISFLLDLYIYIKWDEKRNT